MDKQEYKILSEEIMTLVANEQFVEAVEIADRIDWRKVRSFTMLQRISDLYKINRRFDEALDILFLAYDKNPNSKTIVYGICELYLDMGDLISALQYMSVYNKMAPKDVGGAILKYKILELEEASYEDRVEQLEKICDMSYHAEWAYQLAYMYHRMGLATRCVETCDQLISWFGNGPFVIKAMELKMLHEKLTSYQQEIYNSRYAVEEDLRAYEGDEEVPGVDGEEDFHVKTIDMSKFNTINLQKVLAESMRDLMGEEYDTQSLSSTGTITKDIAKPMEPEQQYYPEENYTQDNYGDNYNDSYNEGFNENYEGEYYPEDQQYYQDDSQNNNQNYESDYNQQNYDNYEQSYAQQPTLNNNYVRNDNPGYVAPDETAYMPAGQSLYGAGETFFDDKTGDIVIDQVPLNMLNNLIPGVEFVATERTTAPINSEGVNEAVKQSAKPAGSSFAEKYGTGAVSSQNATVNRVNKIENKTKSRAFDNHLSYDSDGQISLAMPVKTPIETQITGQMNIVDVLSEWERVKKKKEARQNEQVRQSFMEKTGRIFVDFEESKSETIVAQIEQNKKKMDRVLPTKENASFDATAALNKTYGASIWDEVDAAIEEDNKAMAKALGAGVAVAGGVAAGATLAEAMVAGATAGATGAAMGVAGEGAALVVNSVSDTAKAGIEQKKIITKEMQPDSSLRLVSDGETSNGETSNEEVANEEVTNEGIVQQPDAGAEDYEGEYCEGDEYGYYDEDGNWVEYTGYYDEDGNWVEYTGYYDEDGNWVEYEYEDEVPAEDGADSDSEVSESSEELVTDEVKSEESVDETAVDETASEETEEAVIEEAVIEETVTEETVTEETVTEEADTATEEDVENIESDVEEVASGETEEETVEETVVEESSDSEESSEQDLEESSNESDDESSESEENLEETFNEDMDTAEINNLGDALEQAADQAFEETMDDINDEYTAGDEERDFSEDEQAIFSDYLYSKKMRAQILEAIDIISLASYVGNVFISGDAGANVLGLAKAIIKEIQLIDGNFRSNKVAKISGAKMNQKDIPGMFVQLANGALIIEKASKMNRSTLENLTMALENATDGIIVILTDTKKEIEKIINEYNVITGYFNARVDIVPMSTNALAEYAKRYAYTKEYKIDEETGVLALHERISDLQIGEHHVTVAEIEDIVDEAIAKSKRPRLSTFIDILTAKRYDGEDMIILKEKDFRA